MLSVVLRNAPKLEADELELQAANAYRAIAAVFSSEGPAAGLHPVRFWNFIPGIHDPMRDASGLGSPRTISRYMVFNAGRFKAIEEWRSRPGDSDPPLGGGIAAATGVGHHGTDLTIHALAGETPGHAVENPRQVPAYRYSQKYGPKPPCFARGTIVDGPDGRVLLVGGTASVRGEDSVHGEDPDQFATGNLAAQVRETLANITSLIEAGLGSTAGPRVLRHLLDVRVYHTRPGDRADIARMLEPELSARAELEFVRADICRPELLVEIEGVAALPLSET